MHEAVSGGGMAGVNLPPSWAREGSAIRRAVVADFAAVAGVEVVETVDARCLDSEPTWANVSRILIDSDHPIDLDSLARRANFVVLIAPESGGMLESLAQCVAMAGARSIGSTPEAIHLCTNKFLLAEHFARIGIPTPPTRTCQFGADWPAMDVTSGRVVVKPVDGAGAVDTFVINQTAESADFPELSRYPRFLVQPYRPGPAYSASFLVGRDGRAHRLAVGRQRIELGPRGEVLYEGGEVPVALEGLNLEPVGRAIESVPGLLGFVGVDFVVVEPFGAVEVIEINPRLTTSIVGLVRLASPGTVARNWLGLVVLDQFALEFDAVAIDEAPAVRFLADGSIVPALETPR